MLQFKRSVGDGGEISLVSSNLHRIIIITGNNKTFPLEYWFSKHSVSEKWCLIRPTRKELYQIICYPYWPSIRTVFLSSLFAYIWLCCLVKNFLARAHMLLILISNTHVRKLGIDYFHRSLVLISWFPFLRSWPNVIFDLIVQLDAQWRNSLRLLWGM